MQPQFLNRSVDEHLSDIGAIGGDENTAVMRLREAVENEMAALLQSANDQYSALCAKRGLGASARLKELEQKTKTESVTARLQDLAEVMIASLKNFDAWGTRDIRRVMRQGTNERYIEDLSAVLDEIAQRKEVTPDWVSSVREQIASIKDQMATPTNPDRILYLGISELAEDENDVAQLDAVRDALSSHNDLSEFAHELQQKTKHLESLTTIYHGSTLDSMKINWLGSATDCKVLFTFLHKAGYIEARHINQFIASHFLIKGKPVTPQKLGGLHTGRDGKITDRGDGLLVPTNR